ncbi:Kef-type potassium/proton antiporter, CPA2 family [Allosphingosinicella indica]|uniref:Kef-type potassium/proton antiporter, CPA2 family n=2 Tax=Allosphingosinicella indica TaxID=941907 RepID=A0A1X7H388_9SPHN|nr:Kef-type potassium/proton antiporter, CPA2 family [Allosphingosinicella indica]
MAANMQAMPHHTPLITTIVAALVVAFFLGAFAQKLRVSPIAGYLAAGIVVGPFTPGFVADSAIANELAEIGVILLMFGVGLHFSVRDLMSVKNIAVPGAIAQIATATAMGMGLGWLMGWSTAASLVFGLALSVASTVVLLRALQARNLVQTERGRIAVGWLIVEDIAMVLALVLLPAVAGALEGQSGQSTATIFTALAITLAKVVGFIALMLIVGMRLIPKALHWVVHTGSRELFRLAVLAIALGVAGGAAYFFDVSFALGAFFAGMILGETKLSKRAAEETLPLRDAFAVLFFVSVGMLFNPAIVTEQPLPLIATVMIIVLGKSIAAYGIVRAFGYPNETALTVSASLAQIGEFSFILIGLGYGLGFLPAEARDLVLAGAIFSIFFNPFIFSLILRNRSEPVPDAAAPKVGRDRVPEGTSGHVILIGYGRVGRLIAAGLRKTNREFVVIEDQTDVARKADEDGSTVIMGNATDAKTLDRAGIDTASKLLIAIPEGFEGGAISQKARMARPDLAIIARAHSDAEVEHLTRLGAQQVVMGEREIAAKMLNLSAPLRGQQPAPA